MQYAGHRFSNGPIYTEFFADSLQVPLDSRGECSTSCSTVGPEEISAIGGASISPRFPSATGPNSSLPVTCILGQVANSSVDKTDESETVFIIWAGANDIFWGMDKNGSMELVAEDLKAAVQSLQQIGKLVVLQQWRGQL